MVKPTKFLALVLFALPSLLAGCWEPAAAPATSTTPQEQLVGKWRVDKAGSDTVWEFFLDGTAQATQKGKAIVGTYSIVAEGRLKIDLDRIKMITEYTVKGNKLTFAESGKTVITLTRVAT
jgi:hypothetical protein